MTVNNDLIKKFEELIQEAKKIDWNGLVEEPTFMDIAGYPHYENVCSNILAFFFQTDAVHNMKDLLLKAILKAMKINHQQVYITNEVVREVMTDSGNRIDLVIVTDDIVVAIENKIYASLYNDLVDYSSYLDRVYQYQTRYKVVLSLIPVDQKNLNSGFVNVTYPDLFNEIDQLMGQYWQDADNRYLLLLNDFVKNLKKLMGEKQMDQNVIDYFVKNGEDVEKLMLEVKNYKDYLRETLKNMAARIVIADENICSQWFYREANALSDDLVHDFSIDDAKIAIDTVFDDEKYNIYIWLRKAGKNVLRNKEELIKFLITKGLDQRVLSKTQERHIYHQEFQNQQEALVQLNEMIEKLCH